MRHVSQALTAIEEAQDQLIDARNAGELTPDEFGGVFDQLLAAKVSLSVWKQQREVA